MKDFFIDNPIAIITIIISFFLLLIAFLTYILNKKKYKFDKSDYENKKSNFTVYLENSYRFNYKVENEVFLLFDIRINNYSTLKTSFSAILKINYFLNKDQKTELNVEHNPSLFHERYHENISKFPKQIRVDDREIKSGWIIFSFPKNLLKKRIDFYEIIIEDVVGNQVKIISNLIKEIDYGN